MRRDSCKIPSLGEGEEGGQWGERALHTWAGSAALLVPSRSLSVLLALLQPEEGIPAPGKGSAMGWGHHGLLAGRLSLGIAQAHGKLSLGIAQTRGWKALLWKSPDSRDGRFWKEEQINGLQPPALTFSSLSVPTQLCSPDSAPGPPFPTQSRSRAVQMDKPGPGGSVPASSRGTWNPPEAQQPLELTQSGFTPGSPQGSPLGQHSPPRSSWKGLPLPCLGCRCCSQGQAVLTGNPCPPIPNYCPSLCPGSCSWLAGLAWPRPSCPAAESLSRVAQTRGLSAGRAAPESDSPQMKQFCAK